MVLQFTILNNIMRLDRTIARGSIVFFVLYIIAALPCVVLWAMVVYFKSSLQGHGYSYWIVLSICMSFIINCLYIPLFYSKRKYELSENSGVLIALVDISTLYLFLGISVAVCPFWFLLYDVRPPLNVYYFYFVFYLYYLYFVFFQFRYRFRQYKLLF